MEEQLGLRVEGIRVEGIQLEGHQEKDQEPDAMMELVLVPLAEEHVVGTEVWIIGNIKVQ